MPKHLSEVSGPGVYELDETVYHADTALTDTFGPSLSSTQAKTILHAPALYQYRKQHHEVKHVFDVGTAIHTLVLGSGAEFAVLDFPDRRSKAYKEAETEARGAGQTPILKKDYEPIKNAADAVLTHPVAKRILADGKPEQSIYATDDDTNTTMRGRLDWLRDNAVIDLKTVGQSAHPWRFAKTCADLGYDLQAAWYLQILTAIGYPPDLPYLHVVVEKEPPHLVAVVQLDDESLAAGASQAREALNLYTECAATDTWPGYPEEITPISLPAYHLNKHL